MKTSKVKATGNMEKVIKARFLEGTFKPLERVELEEGKEVTVTIREFTNETKDAFKLAMGGWKGKINCEKQINNIYKSRQLSTKRPAVEL
ncbi:hypothetical protein C5S29_07790 [ANME-1 cluster archaeon GoMg3.2]|nr:hypothetical protein [ANME-1 cluster archaeon GoMg3.2]